uniref:Secreted protein n=1 Tax=Panagrellus redivivus TaxID=6233 RepID=A0A7E4W0N0_PANRE
MKHTFLSLSRFTQSSVTTILSGYLGICMFVSPNSTLAFPLTFAVATEAFFVFTSEGSSQVSEKPEEGLSLSVCLEGPYFGCREQRRQATQTECVAI